MDKIGKNKLEKIDGTDYKVFFYLGIIFTLGGFVMFIATRNPPFLPIMSFGIILKIYSFLNKDKWHTKN